VLLPFTLIGAFLSISIQASNPAILGFAIDSLSGEDYWQLQPEHYCFLILGLGLSRALLYVAYRYGLATMTYQLEADLRSIFFNHSTKLGLSFFDKMQTGQLVSRANADIRALQMFLAFSPFMFITLVGFFAAIIYMLYTDFILTLLAVFALPGVYLLGLRLRSLMFPLNWINQQRLAELTSIVDENINGVRIVRSFTAEKREIEKLAHSALKLKWSNNQLVHTNAAYGPLIENLPRLGIAAVLFYGGLLVIDGEIGIGALLAFNLYMMQLVTPFRMIGVFLIMERRAAASAQRIFEVLDEQAEITNTKDAHVLKNSRGEIEFRNVSFNYASFANINSDSLLKSLSFKVAPGETVALVGRTGSGKSTIAKLLLRLYECEGNIFIDGHNLKNIALPSLRENIGMVMDEAFLFSTSIADNIAFTQPDASIEDIIEAAKKADAHNFIDALPEGYNTVVGERGYTLSGGQRQRIALARMFLTNPPMVVLDDSTSAIDVETESRIHNALKAALEKRTTLVIAHRLSTISLADRVLLMENGQIIADGTHHELMKNNADYRKVLAQVEKGEVKEGTQP
jgi:ATP-binding cassette subfamily B protein